MLLITDGCHTSIVLSEFDRTDKQEDAHESSSDSDDEHTPLPSRHSNSGSGPPPNRASTSVKALAVRVFVFVGGWTIVWRWWYGVVS